MKIALIGYGKMGKTIEQIALDRGHEIVLKIDISNQADLTVENLKKADVAIEFTIPKSAVANYKLCFEAGTPVVSGTTGWLEHKEEVEQLMKAKNGTFFYASNFSLGVNLFFALNKKLAKLMAGREGYDVSMVEVHHTQKLDAPSGTAISLAEDLFENYPAKTSWTLEAPKSAEQMHIEAIREGQVPGIHRIKYESEVDHILIEHDAKSRHGFALGAVLAAEYSHDKKGMLNMNDLLNL
ncbi:4-hydroxy-tetrahydrodipicolinate reductase [Mangrovibacterium marinum]|uniref:4-hydroxy-tetrahydrodipicolinate reductase n=1 Tax=Mangrovibacterium marinum TaxID=1639118 RepID=A0A2T5BY89_9BACT|nr:4-hydroxy-tetrahydrodipicolinate reductase [Mangrovibacterium marinum]PTN06793.1 dihydrodipicolinate reductase [Mangrovibacterium marinum]